MIRKVFIAFFLVLAVLLCGCGPKGPRYTAENIKVGMTKEKVLTKFGEPDGRNYWGSFFYLEAVQGVSYQTYVSFEDGKVKTVVRQNLTAANASRDSYEARKNSNDEEKAKKETERRLRELELEQDRQRLRDDLGLELP